jgi:hypothetical protein
MFIPNYDTQPMDQLDVTTEETPTGWIWNGFLARGSLTLLTSIWKSGKTTLLTGLLRTLADGRPFLGRACEPARVLVVSEESRQHWKTRLATMPVGAHTRLMSRPFRGRPTPDQWNELLDRCFDMRQRGELDLIAIDPLASFLPGHSDSDAGTLMTMLHPLQRLAADGAAVLLLHHPRKKASNEGSSARGSGALLGFVDIIVELSRFGRLASDVRRRKLIAFSRYEATPYSLYYQWDPATGAFEHMPHPFERRYRDNWPIVKLILNTRSVPATHLELLMDWPADREKPPTNALYDWLNRATAEKLVRRFGNGRKADPYRYLLPFENEK